MSIFALAGKEEFPALQQEVHGRPLVYLDNAATTQKPREVISAILEYYERDNANVHRGIHALSDRATAAFENARAASAEFLGARSEEIIFTRGTTEGINLLANTIGREAVSRIPRIVITEMEHHSNLVPWQMLAEQTGARVDFIPVLAETGTLDLEAAERLLSEPVGVFACTHISNTLGTVNPVRELCRMAASAGAVTIVDAAQSAGHRPVSVSEIGCDFLVCSGHKMCGPMGIGLLFGRSALLREMEPWQGGGEMISKVTYEGSTWSTPPHKFEAGTPNVEGAIGLRAALRYLERLGREEVMRHDLALAREAMEKLAEVPGVRIFGPPADDPGGHAGAVSFSIDGIHAHDVVTLADGRGIALRGGHHCNQPLMRKLGVPATARASFYCYNDSEDIDRFVVAIGEITAKFGRAR